MRLINIIFGVVTITTLFSCENEVEINAEFEEKTFVLGLLSAQSDTNFVKITKTFLSNTSNAIELAQDPNNLYYDTLDVTLNELNDNNNVVNEHQLKRVLRPKNEGLFTAERNEVYFTDATLEQGTSYTLSIDKLDGSEQTSGEATITSGVTIERPREVNSLALADFRLDFDDYRFEFSPSENVGDFSASMVFNYYEVRNTDSVLLSITIPIASFTNSRLSTEKETFIFEGEKFFDAIAAAIPPSINAPPRILVDDNIDVIVEAADSDYTLYRDVNGPIDGLAQVRPEYTNVTNGIGLFASRSKTISTVSMNEFTKRKIVDLYGNRNNLSQFRGFEIEQ